jgi:hypothetical protein
VGTGVSSSSRVKVESRDFLENALFTLDTVVVVVMESDLRRRGTTSDEGEGKGICGMERGCYFFMYGEERKGETHIDSETRHVKCVVG